MAAALHHLKTKYLELKYTSICEWKKVISSEEEKIQQPVTESKSKKRGRLSKLPNETTIVVMKYISAIRDSGGIINKGIVIATGLGIVKRMDQRLLECNVGMLY